MKADGPDFGKLNEALAAELRAEQGRLGWSRARLQKASGIPKNTLERIMLGRADIRSDHLYALAAVLGVRASVLMARAEAGLDDDDPMERHMRGFPE